MLRLPPGLLACGPGQGRSAFTVYQRRQHPPSLQKEFNHLHYLLGTFTTKLRVNRLRQCVQPLIHTDLATVSPSSRLSPRIPRTPQTLYIPPSTNSRHASSPRSDARRRHFTLARNFLIHPSTLYLVKFGVDRLEPESGNCRGALHHDQQNAISLGSRTTMLGLR